MISYRAVNMNDAEFLFALKNDADVCQSSILSREGVQWYDHLVWLNKTLQDRLTGFWIVLEDGVSVGTFRTTPFAGHATEVAVHLVSNRRGNGLGSRVLDDWCRGGKFVARIVDTNVASIALFTKAGFVPGKQQSDVVPYRFYYLKGF